MEDVEDLPLLTNNSVVQSLIEGQSQTADLKIREMYGQYTASQAVVIS